MAEMNPDEQAQCELAEILWEKPLAGVFDEVLFGSDRGNTVWVKFSDKDGMNDWVGKFGVGSYGAPRLEKVKYPDAFLVTAGSYGYVVNATTRTLLNSFHEEFVQAVAFDPKTNRFVVADYVRLHLVESGRIVSSSKRIAIDGLRILKQEGRMLFGLAVTDYDGNESAFTFNLDTFEAICQVDCSVWDEIPASHPAKGRKPWWKFW